MRERTSENWASNRRTETVRESNLSRLEQSLGTPDVSIEDLKKPLPIELERANVELRKRDNSLTRDSYYKAHRSILAMHTKEIVADA